MNNYIKIVGYIIIVIIILLIVINQSRKKLLIMENTFLNLQKDLQYAEYQELQQHEDEIHKLYHDIGNHINTIQILIQSGEISEAEGYMKELIKLHQEVKRIYYCTNKVIDAVLTQKRKLCDANGIRFETELMLPQELPFQETDIMRLYSELIDLAIKGCLSNSKAYKLINVASMIENNSLLLKVSGNRLDRNILNIANKRHQKPMTDNTSYNVSIKLINEIVESLGGTKEVIENNSDYIAVISLPINS